MAPSTRAERRVSQEKKKKIKEEELYGQKGRAGETKKAFEKLTRWMESTKLVGSRLSKKNNDVIRVF